MADFIGRTVTVHIPRPGAGNTRLAVWYKELGKLLENAPPGVEVSEVDHGAMVGLADVVSYFRDKVSPTRLRYNARLVFFWFVDNATSELEMECMACGLRRTTDDGGCRCLAQGRSKQGVWHYRNMDTPDRDTSDNWWRITEASLLRLNEREVNSAYLRATSRAHIIEFLMFLRARSRRW